MIPLCCSCKAHRTGSVSVLTPDKFSRTGIAELNKRWWESFGDPELNRLADRVLADNLSLKQAWARLEQAKAAAQQAAASWHPQITAEAGAGRTRSNSATTSGGTESYDSNRYLTTGSVSYEADLWGRIASLSKAANAEAAASKSDLDAMAVSLTAEVAETWFSIIEQNALLHLTHKQSEVSQTYLKLIQLRFGQGLVSALDVWQQRQQLAEIRSQIPLLESKLQVLLHKLAVLAGQPPRTEIAPFPLSLPNLPALPATGLPSELLKSRPDVEAARLRATASDARLGAAISDRFPAFRLSASGGFRAAKVSELFESLIWDILGNVSGTVWDGGRKSGEIDKNRAVLKERAAQYVQTALGAFQEVEDALIREDRHRDYLEKLASQLDFAKKSLNEARSRYLNGLSDYLTVLTSLKSVQSLEQNLISAQKQLLSYRIQLYKALGGGWQPSGFQSSIFFPFQDSGDGTSRFCLSHLFSALAQRTQRNAKKCFFIIKSECRKNSPYIPLRSPRQG